MFRVLLNDSTWYLGNAILERELITDFCVVYIRIFDNSKWLKNYKIDSAKNL